MMSLEKTKTFLGERVFSSALTYLEKENSQNLEQLFKLVKKAPLLPGHRERLEEVHRQYRENPNIQEYIKRVVNETDELVKKRLLVNFFIHGSLAGIPKQRELEKKLGYGVPFTILLDPTSRCNLNCEGCWAGAYNKYDELTYEEVNRLIEEAKEMGIHFITMSGGEPLLWPHLFDLFANHTDVAFMVYTNGTLINRPMAQKLKELGNVSLAISLEGPRELTDARRGQGVFDKVMEAMDFLKENGQVFGISLTLTRKNWKEALSDEFIDLLIEKGVLYGWSFHYIPIGREPNFDLVLQPEERSELVERIRYIRQYKPLPLADFWNDGELAEGCIAGGRRYFHITAAGDVEPCAFIHFSNQKIFGKSLIEILADPLFLAYQKRQPFSKNLLRPCPLIDIPKELREIVEEVKAEPTHPGADVVLKGETAKKIEELADRWAEKADKIS